MSKGFKVDIKSSLKSMSLLQYAAYIDAIDAIKYLVENGADIYYKNGCGKTLLPYCLKQSTLDYVETLIASNKEPKKSKEILKLNKELSETKEKLSDVNKTIIDSKEEISKLNKELSKIRDRFMALKELIE